MKKNKIINIIVGVALCISLCGNVYLFQRLSSDREAIAVMSNQVIVADESIAELNNQLSQYEDLENQILDLQDQLNQSSNKIANLEQSLQASESEKTDLETKISDLETQISDKEAIITGLEAQHQSSTITNNTSTQQIQQPTNEAPPLGLHGTFKDMMEAGSGTGDGNGAGFGGHYE